MSEYTRQFERTRARFGTADLRLQEMYRRRDRKRRNEKIGALILALIIALASTAAILSTIGGSRGPTPASQTITPGTVGQLQLQWTGDMGSEAAPPVVTDGVVVTATRSGHALAFPDRCASDGSACTPLWTAEIGRVPAVTDRADPTITWWPSSYGAPGESEHIGAFTGADGFVYSGSRSGQVAAFDVHCRTDGGTCGPTWTADIPFAAGAIIVADDLVVVEGSHGTFAFRVGCASGGASCDPVWSIPQNRVRVQDGVVYGTNRFSKAQRRDRAYSYDLQNGKPIWWSAPEWCCSNDPTPVAYGDSVYVNFGHLIEAFPADCRGLCEPTWSVNVPDRFSSAPVVVGDTVAITVATDGSTGGVMSFPVGCTSRGRTCSVVHRADGFPELTSVGPQVAGDRLYAESLRGGGGVYVFDGACLARRDYCHAVWADIAAIQPWDTVVQDGVAYVTDITGRLTAFDAGCANKTCRPLWESSQTPESTPFINDGEVIFTGNDGVIYAYAPGLPRGAGSKTGAAWFYGALALGGLVVVAGRVVRRRRLA